MYLVVRFFVWKLDEEDDTGIYIDFQCKLPWELVKNDLLKVEKDEVEKRRMLLFNKHDHILAPPHATI